MNLRIGFGSDIHRFVSGPRKLILGGVEIPYHKGLIGNSDADVLLHAICDAILGGISEGDIGKHFPPDDPRYADISSLVLLSGVARLADSKKYKVMNIDSMIVCEKPKLAPFIPKMVENISNVLKIQPAQVSIKATTSEGLGFTGRGEGILANAVVLLMGE
jgi:2-C-methyl-D-erythritol 2,4-cyclodiphosphate synthase